MVRTARESFKRFIKIILGQITPHIESYSSQDQILLTEFLTTLQDYEKADYQRDKFSEQLVKYYNSVFLLEAKKHFHNKLFQKFFSHKYY